MTELYPKNSLSYYRDTRTPTFIDVLFMIAKEWNEPNGANRWMRKQEKCAFRCEEKWNNVMYMKMNMGISKKKKIQSYTESTCLMGVLAYEVCKYISSGECDYGLWNHKTEWGGKEVLRSMQRESWELPLWGKGKAPGSDRAPQEKEQSQLCRS